MKHQLQTIREALEFFECGSYSTSKALTAITALSELERMAGEPYGTVTVVRNPGRPVMHWFYRWPEPPYLDNAAECHTVYAAPPAQQPPEIEVQCPVCAHKFYEWPKAQQPQYEAGDMASAHNDGFRAGVASVAQQPQEPEMTPAFRSSNAYTVGFQDGKAQALAQQPQAVPPANCRQRLKHDGKAYPRSSCAACGEFSPKWKECDAAMAQGEKP